MGWRGIRTGPAFAGATRTAALVTGLYVALFCSWLLTGWGGRSAAAVISDAAFLPMSLTAAVFSWRAAGRSRANRRRAQAWRFIAVSYVCYWLGDLGWFYFDAVRGMRPYPSLADIGYLSFYPFLAAGLLRLPTSRRTPRERAVLALDTATVTIASLLVMWYLIIGPTVRADAAVHTAWLARGLDVAYPVGDVLVLFALAVVLLRQNTEERDVSLIVLTGGLVLFVAADVIYARMSLDGTYTDGSWVNALWMAGQALTIISAYRANRQALGRPQRARAVRHVSQLPYLAIAGALALLLTLSIEQLSASQIALVGGVAIITAVVALRQLTALQENGRLMAELRHVAATDHLTGLASRAQFFASADALFISPRHRSDKVGLLMIDVDHFKSINDRYGHAFGDTVLRHVTATIRHTVRTGDLVARYGGDEIVVLLPSCPQAALEQIASKITLAVHSTPLPGTDPPVFVTVSVGGAQAEATATLAEVLAHADRALYQTKRAGRDNWAVHRAHDYA